MKLFEVNGYYGSQNTPTTVYCATDRNGGTWYVCEGSQNINYTFDSLHHRVNVENLRDEDIMTGKVINSLEELEEAIND